jgi:hypothetical protein
MFALGLHFGRIQSDKLTWGDVALCVITVLAMAKIVFLTFVILVLWSYFFGDQLKKRRMKKVTASLLCSAMIYAVFFPGVFAYNTSVESLVNNFKGRFYDLAMTAESKSIKKIDNTEPISSSPGRLNHADQIPKSAGHESGYASIAENALPYLMIALFFLIPFYLKGFNELNVMFPEYKDTTLVLLFVVLLMPLITSFLEGAVFWFIAGFAFLPLLLHAGVVHSCNDLSNSSGIA